MGSLKWEVVRTQLEQSNNKLEYVQEKFSKYNSSSKYAPAFCYLGNQVLNFVLESLVKTKTMLIEELTSIALEVVKVLESEEVVLKYVNKIAPHILQALSKKSGDVAVHCMCSVADGMFSVISSFGKQAANNATVGNLLKTLQKQEDVGVKVRLFVYAIQYLPLCTDTKHFTNIPGNCLHLLREMDCTTRAARNERMWELVQWCLDEDVTSRLSDLILQLTQFNIEDGNVDSSQVDTALERISGKMSLRPLRALFQLIRQTTLVVTSSERFTDISLPDKDLYELFGTNQKDTIWILLALSQHLSFCLLLQPFIPTSWFQLIFEICRLMCRSPQETLRVKSSKLMDHTQNCCNISNLQYSLDADDVFKSYSHLLSLRAQSLKSSCTCDVTSDVSRFVSHLQDVAAVLVNGTRKIQILELGMVIEGQSPSESYIRHLASLHRKQGHLSDAILLLSDIADPAAETLLLLSLCHITKLDCGPAASVLDRVESLEDVVRCSAAVMSTYCKFVNSLRQREVFVQPDPVQFCKDAHAILKSPTQDDTLLCILMFLSGLHGLTRITAQCATLLSPHPDNLISVLSAVPSLLAHQTQIPWTSDLETLTSRNSKRDQIQEIWEKHDVNLRTVNHTDRQPDKQTDTSESALYCGVCAYVLVDKSLTAGDQVYDIIEKCASNSLKAAFTKLKSWKNTSMSTRALLWQNCCMIPYVLHVLARYITLLLTWGSVHMTFVYLDRFEQLAKFTGSEHWISKHANLSAVVRVTLQTPVKTPSVKMPSSPEKEEMEDNVYLSDFLEMEKYRVAETQIVAAAAQRNGDEGSVAYPVFSSSLRPLHLTQLTILQLQLSWPIAPPSQEIIVEYFHILKKARKSWSCDIPVELEKMSSAWLALLADSQPSLPDKVENNKPAVKSGRVRKTSASKQSLRSTSTRATAARLAAGKTNSMKQTATKKERAKRKDDHISAGLATCSGLEPVFVKRELLKRKIKRTPVWDDVEEFHEIPFRHQLLKLNSSFEDTHFPESWTVASITKVDNTLFIGQRRAGSNVLFKRELPYSLKSQVVGADKTCCLDEMKRIMSSNDDSVLHVQDKVQFWNSRFKLNSNLETLCDRLEEDWLGPWRGLLMGCPVEEAYREKVKNSAEKLRKEVKTKYKVSLEVFISEYVLDYYSFLTEDHISELLPDLPLEEILVRIHDLAPSAPPNRHPTLLILGPETDILPWEACKLYKNQPISRIPSLNFAFTLLRLKTLPVKLEPQETFYILNPSQNLPSTQACFEGWLADQEGWRGVAAKAPSIPEYQGGLQSDMFLYLGHGSGKEYLGGKPIQELESRAVALLMGCSSGKIKQTPVGGTGTPVEYLLSGCPAVLGYLWNITDRDCDRYSKKLLELWLSEGDSTSLLSLMNPSRDACKLPFLVGAAPVLYGLPDILANSEA